MVELATEITNRESADAQLQSQIDIEIKNRETADAKLQTQVDTVVRDLATESKDRESADAKLQSQIDLEIKNREAKDEELRTQITASLIYYNKTAFTTIFAPADPISGDQVSVAIEFERIGDSVRMTFGAVAIQLTQGTADLRASQGIYPLWATPTLSQSFFSDMRNGATRVIGYIALEPTGIILRPQASATGWTATPGSRVGTFSTSRTTVVYEAVELAII
jgi:hypothetical protein